jgi:hypothetical protein
LGNDILGWHCFVFSKQLRKSHSYFVEFQDYSEMSVAYRPSHADATYDMKYGVRSVQVVYLTNKHSDYKDTVGFIMKCKCDMVYLNSN